MKASFYYIMNTKTLMRLFQFQMKLKYKCLFAVVIEINYSGVL